jgi:20S proteasome subunit alpha 6
VGIAIAGLTSDARVLSNFMKSQSTWHKLTYGRAMPLSSLAERIGDKAQYNTQMYGARPYGVGLLVAGIDDQGPHLFEFQPSGLVEEMTAFAIGARSQMARTYLERNIAQFADSSREELVRHALRALRESLAQDKHLTVDNTSVGIVGIKEGGNGKAIRVEPFTVYNDQDVREWIEAAEQEAAPAPEAAAAATTAAAEPEPEAAQAPAAEGGDGMEVDG